MYCFKFLNHSMWSPNNNTLFHQDKWAPKISGKLIPCKRGYHVLRTRDLSQWVYIYPAYDLWLVEVPPKGHVKTSDKMVVRTLKPVRKIKLNRDYYGCIEFRSWPTTQGGWRKKLSSWGLRAAF
jgi:hypothetical protein